MIAIPEHSNGVKEFAVKIGYLLLQVLKIAHEMLRNHAGFVPDELVMQIMS